MHGPVTAKMIDVDVQLLQGIAMLAHHRIQEGRILFGVDQRQQCRDGFTQIAPDAEIELASPAKSIRKGKHYLVVGGILKNMETLPSGSALKIPLAPLGGVTVLELRSAVMRAVNKRKIGVETSSDDENFYIWRT